MARGILCSLVRYISENFDLGHDMLCSFYFVLLFARDFDRKSLVWKTIPRQLSNNPFTKWNNSNSHVMVFVRLSSTQKSINNIFRCKHCMNFAPTYSEIARHFHSDPDSNVRVGKVDTTTEKALGQRFNVNSFPTFFVVHGSRVYEFEGSYSKSNLIRFATKGHKDEKPIPFYSSPMGPLGRLQGFLIWAGVTLMSFFSWAQNTTGLSPILVGCLLCVFAVFGGMAIMIILVIALTPREKVD